MSGDVYTENGRPETGWIEDMSRRSEDFGFVGRNIPKSIADSLKAAIEQRVIPSLIQRHRSPTDSPSPATHSKAGDVRVEPADIHRLAHALASGDQASSDAIVTGFLDRQLSPSRLRLELLTPTARLLGDWWNEDVVSFAQVSSGLGRLHHVMRAVDTGDVRARPSEPTGNILLVAMPGDRHHFGISMVEAFFREAGWAVSLLINADETAILRAITGDKIDIVGFSAARAELLPDLAALIARLRATSSNKNLRILVGGPPFLERPERCSEVGADATAADGGEAVLQATKVLARDREQG